MGAGARNRRPGVERDKEGQRGLLSFYNGMSQLLIIHTRKKKNIYIYIGNIYTCMFLMGLPGGSGVKNLPANVADSVLIPGSQRSLEKGMATHSSILAWEIPWTEKPDGPQIMELQNSWT